VAHATGGQQLELGKAGAELAHQRDVRAGAGSDAREVEHDHLPQPGVRQPRQRLARAEPGQLDVARDDASRPQIEAERERGVRQLSAQPFELRMVRERLRADDDARRSELEQRPDRGGLRHAGIDHQPGLARQGRDGLAVGRSAVDRIEIGDVELVESEHFADGASDLDGVGAGDEPAAQVAVAFALPAHGVHGGSALEIDDRDHSHGRGGSRMGGVIGLDVGGANTKAVWLGGSERRAVSRPFEVWRDRGALTAVLREVVAGLAPEPVEAVALTTTAELSDAFRTKREGVEFVLDAAEAALRGPELLAFTTAGEVVPVAEARARAPEVAAANWLASALAVAAVYPDALMIDVGSTTADIVPVAGGRVLAAGRTDLDRLLAGELVYTGALRTNLAAIAPRVPVRGGWCPVASELFAISADAQLILGHLAPTAYTCATPDGRPATVEFARERVARLVCADSEQLAVEEIDAIAEFLHAEQVRQIQAAARRVSGRVEGDPPVVPLGAGAFLARAAATRLGRAVVELPWSAAEREAAPAAALAELLAGRLGPHPSGRAAPAPVRRGPPAPVRRGPPAVLTVVKVGGGLAREAGDGALRTLCRAIGDAGAGHELLVVPGGGAFADVVRKHDGRFGLRPETAHRMAILAMEQFGWLLSELIPGGVACTDLAPARAIAARGRTPVLLPAAPLADDPLPVSWAVTSDSIAAWVAGTSRAGRLVLVKPVAGLYRDWPADGAPLAQLDVGELAELRAAGRAAGVDPHLSEALRAAGVEAWVIDGREPARLMTLLETGSTEGTLVTAGVGRLGTG
jgi:probable H4MPT-linked C1 transfer pathway protein